NHLTADRQLHSDLVPLGDHCFDCRLTGLHNRLHVAIVLAKPVEALSSMGHCVRWQLDVLVEELGKSIVGRRVERTGAFPTCALVVRAQDVLVTHGISPLTHCQPGSLQPTGVGSHQDQVCLAHSASLYRQTRKLASLFQYVSAPINRGSVPRNHRLGSAHRSAMRTTRTACWARDCAKRGHAHRAAELLTGGPDTG